jgi:cation diffusion facilitator CzcD-associated flavoprotein CzcO
LSAVLDRGERWCLVGAGPGGLCAARWLAALDVPFDGFEAQQDVGGIWDISFPGSPMYESCHFISSRTLSGFRDHPMPASYPDYPRHDLVLRYLRGYADRYGLKQRFRFGTAVRGARPDGVTWLVEAGDGPLRRYAGIVSAVGNEWRPSLPELSGGFAGEAIHSSAYRSAEQLRGRRVLVVGAGNSGCDIAVDAAGVAAFAAISMRRGYHFVPKHILGRPADVFADSGPPLPGWLERPLFERLLRLLNGDPGRLGLPPPDHRIFETHPILNSAILDRLAHGDLEVRPDVSRLEGRDVEFQDGRRERYDLLVLATGYTRGVPFLERGILADDDVSRLALNLFHREHPGLVVVGHFTTDAGAFPILDLQCELAARAIAARRSDPARAGRLRRALAGPRPDFTRGVRYAPVRRMANYVSARPYKRHLSRLLQPLR